MKLELVVGLFIVFSTICLISLNDSNSKDVFSTWKESHQVQFQNEGEQMYRKRIFMKNLERINQFNSEESNLYKMGVNQFTIYTQEQFAQRYLNPISDQQIREVVRKSLNEEFLAVLIDWTEKGAVGPVRDQGSSGSSALYATLGGVQGFSKVKTGKLQTFSAQQLIDCVYGSTGSLLTEGYAYYKKHSVCTTDQYPFSGKPATCQEKNNCKFKISDYVEVKTCSDLANAIMKQPVSVAVDASNWYTYRSGIFTNCASSVNHMVLLVGIADQYWKCKNSWGVGWGQRGFIRLARGNTCGICSFAIYPV